MPELTAVLVAKNKARNEEHRFLAAIQGVDLDEGSSKSTKSNGRTKFDDMKDRVFGPKTTAPDDIMTLNDPRAVRTAGFGVGDGLEIAVLDESSGGTTSW